MNFRTVTKFENQIAEYFGSPYAVSIDCCTHGIELCLRMLNVKTITVPTRGMILTVNKKAAMELKRMSYDGRVPDVPWREQNISTMGYHYYMAPETAQIGLDKLPTAINTKPKKWVITDWPDLTKMGVFSK